jgi:hypothetical protein
MLDPPKVAVTVVVALVIGKFFLAFNKRVSFRDDYYCYFSFPDTRFDL